MQFFSIVAQKGSQVEEFQKICEVQSDKAAVEITSRYAGVIKQLYHSPGDVVQVQQYLVLLQQGMDQALQLQPHVSPVNAGWITFGRH